MKIASYKREETRDKLNIVKIISEETQKKTKMSGMEFLNRLSRQLGRSSHQDLP